MNLLERDKNVIWHPYTQHGFKEDFLPVKSASGAYITLEDDRKILDGISSWWVNLHGHSEPSIAEAIARQAKKLEHILFAGFTHEPAVELAEILVNAMSERKTDLKKVFYSDNGSTAVEVALKMAFQYHINNEKKSRPKFLALRSSYHGDTFGAMAVGEPEGYHGIFRSLLPKVDFVTPDNIEELKNLVLKNKDQYAALIFEPLVQGAGGMQMHSPKFLFQCQEICRSENILTIADEIFTGFYRTGTAFAFEQAKLSPDFICLSKGITGGFLPLAATLTTENIFEKFKTSDMKNAFLHGHSYTANPLACAAGVASWKLLNSAKTQENIKLIARSTEHAIKSFSGNKSFVDCRNLGTIGAATMNLDFNYMSNHSAWFKRKAIEKGVLLRPLGAVLYGVPPYCSTEQEIEKIYSVIGELVDEKCFELSQQK